MKQPRVTDFDPNAKVPKLSSPMDNLPSIEKPKKPQPPVLQPSLHSSVQNSSRIDVNKSRRRDVTTSPSHDVDKSVRREVMTLSSHDVTDFEINRIGVSHDTLRLPKDESKAIDEVIAYLKWEYDQTIFKNDVCRVALHYLLEDFKKNGRDSEAVSRLRKKKSRGSQK